jgi:hypothetical protein
VHIAQRSTAGRNKDMHPNTRRDMADGIEKKKKERVEET